jgi:hypothetical protein
MLNGNSALQREKLKRLLEVTPRDDLVGTIGNQRSIRHLIRELAASYLRKRFTSVLRNAKPGGFERELNHGTASDVRLTTKLSCVATRRSPCSSLCKASAELPRRFDAVVRRRCDTLDARIHVLPV